MGFDAARSTSRCLAVVALAAAAGCASLPSDGGPTQGERVVGGRMERLPDAGDETAAAVEVEAEPSHPRDLLPEVTCDDPVPAFYQGERIGEICERVAEAHGYTVIDLSDRWTPVIFTEARTLGEKGRQPYRRTYLGLADESYGKLRGSEPRTRYLELYGIFPTFRVLATRMEDEERHRCHDAVDDSALAEVSETLSYRGRSGRDLQRRARQVSVLRNRLDRARERLGLDSVDELEGHPRHGALYARYAELRPDVDAVAAVQEHLRCEGLLSSRVRRGSFDWATGAALRNWQTRHMIVSPGLLDEFTRELLQEDSRHWEYRAALRALRERVVDATGLIEDGSARREWGRVMGLVLDADAFRADAGQPAVPGGAPDLISPATEAAARALGWESPEATLEFLRALGPGGTRSLRVAVQLPEVPGYHSEHMDLRAVIDRGDVYYEYGNRGRRVKRRPVNTLFLRQDGREIALVRWPTTIGGWQAENHPDGGVGQRYKESPPGSRIWRDVVASPSWLPPESTPDEELVHQVGGRWVPNYSLFGPGYRSAYGLVMMMHHEKLPPSRPGGEPRYRDEGIRSHGSVSYRSILTGHSHGCHRLYNHLAVRLASFLVRHRRHVRQGSIPVDFAREVLHEGEEIEFRIDTRGYLFELTPPVPVEVLEGNILGRQKVPSRGFRDVRRDEEPVTPGDEAASDEAAETGGAPAAPATTDG